MAGIWVLYKCCHGLCYCIVSIQSQPAIFHFISTAWLELEVFNLKFIGFNVRLFDIRLFVVEVLFHRASLGVSWRDVRGNHFILKALERIAAFLTCLGLLFASLWLCLHIRVESRPGLVWCDAVSCSVLQVQLKRL